MLVASLLLSLVACDRANGPDSFESLMPFASLGEVHLGMRASQLLRQRPSARFAPYSGYAETVDSVQFRYSFGGTGERGVRFGARLESLIASRHFADSAVARLGWNAVVDAVVRERGVPMRCTASGDEPRVRRAMWSNDDVQLVISLHPPTHTGLKAIPDRVGHLVTSRKFARNEPVVPCAQLLRR